MNRDEMTIGSLAPLVNRSRDKLLAGPGRAADQNRNGRTGGQVDFVRQLPHERA